MNKAVLIVGLVAVAAVSGFVAYHFFAPESARQVDQDFPPTATSNGAAAAPQAIKSGALKDGAPGHSVSGSVVVFRASDGSHFLRFEDYSQTQGPDVFLYLTPKPTSRCRPISMRPRTTDWPSGARGSTSSSATLNYSSPARIRTEVTGFKVPYD